MPQTTQEVVLVHKAQQGDIDAFEDLVSRYDRKAYTVASLLLGEDGAAEYVLREALVAAYAHLGNLPEGADFGEWLLQGVTEACLNEVGHGAGRQAADPAQFTRPDWMPNGMLARICRLPDAERVVLVLFTVRGWSYQEIAAALRCPVSAVRSLLHRARMVLRVELTA